MPYSTDIRIPFCGFHESEASTIMQDHEDQEDRFASEYVTVFTKFFNNSCGLDVSFKFKELIRPEFYDEDTDAIICRVSHDDVRKIYEATDQAILTDYIDHCGLSGFERSLTDWSEQMIYELLMACLTSYESETIDYFDLIDTMAFEVHNSDAKDNDERLHSA